MRERKLPPIVVEMPDGTTYTVRKLLGNDTSNTKLAKSAGSETRIFGLSMSPHTLGGYNVCAAATPGCIASCINTSGLGVYRSVQRGRLAKKLAFFKHREAFIAMLKREIANAVKTATRKGYKVAVRLNVFSDLPWEKICDVIQSFPQVQFYDYTKRAERLGNTPPNYYLTLSHSETNDATCRKAIADGHNVAVPFLTKRRLVWGDDMPKEYYGVPTIDGDAHDVRFLDLRGGYVVALRAKGKGRKDKTGFVVPLTP